MCQCVVCNLDQCPCILLDACYFMLNNQPVRMPLTLSLVNRMCLLCILLTTSISIVLLFWTIARTRSVLGMLHQITWWHTAALTLTISPYDKLATTTTQIFVQAAYIRFSFCEFHRQIDCENVASPPIPDIYGILLTYKRNRYCQYPGYYTGYLSPNAQQVCHSDVFLATFYLLLSWMI